MNRLRHRSLKKELLDGDDLPFDDLRQNIKELNIINTYLGGHAITIAGLKTLLCDNDHQELSICEIGCGGGDNLNALSRWCNKRSIAVSFTGIDLKPACTSLAAEQYPALCAKWITSDYREVDFGTSKPHILFCSLFCHHFTNEELVQMLGWMRANSTIGFFINDLHRHPLAYHSIKIITKLFSQSYLVKNDAPLSVARGFTKAEWQIMIYKAALVHPIIKWKWAFRHLIVIQSKHQHSLA